MNRKRLWEKMRLKGMDLPKPFHEDEENANYESLANTALDWFEEMVKEYRPRAVGELLARLKRERE